VLKNLDQKGHILFITLVFLVSTLSITVSASKNLISRIHNFSTIDDANKAYYVAESLGERLLVIDNKNLESFYKNKNCNENCILSFEDGSIAMASINALGNSDESFNFDILKDKVYEVNLVSFNEDNTFDICWNGLASLKISYLYYNSYKYHIQNYSYRSHLDLAISNTFDPAYPKFSYENCFSFTTFNQPVALRVMPIYQNAKVTIVTDPGDFLPLQGFNFNIKGIHNQNVKYIDLVKLNKADYNNLDYSNLTHPEDSLFIKK